MLLNMCSTVQAAARQPLVMSPSELVMHMYEMISINNGW